MSGPLPPTVYRRRRLLAGVVAAIVLVVLVAVVARLGDGDSGSDPADAASGADDPARPVSTSSSAPRSTTSTTTPTGQFTRATGGTAVVGTSGPIYTYAVETERGSGVDAQRFATAVDRILGDRRGWTTADGVRLQRVSTPDANFVVRLATPVTTDLLCLPLDTEGKVSCGHNNLAVINLTRWQQGAAPSKLDLADYRNYVITHEFGHLLGHRHVTCAGPGQRATTMMQQTYDIGACTPNPWPAPDA